MKSLFKYSVMVVLAFIAVACNQQSQQVAENESSAEVAEMPMPVNPLAFNVGDHIPNDLVCMVNDEYMGKKQIPVEFGGNTYFGCCDMCVKRIPTDETVRVAVDPLTGEQVDKSQAYIVMMNEMGAVAYFSSKSNYDAFISQKPQS